MVIRWKALLIFENVIPVSNPIQKNTQLYKKIMTTRLNEKVRHELNAF